jgi:uncharacterized protein (TIGR02246 family)
MRYFTLLLGMQALSLGCGGAASPASPPPQASAASANACDVWAREASFAKSVADHDGAAFAEHVHPKAIFIEGDGSFTRGRDAITLSWKDILEGKKLRLAWHPANVALVGDGETAVSRGPYLFEDLRPDAKQRFRKGTFQSTWTRGKDGVWRVTLDGGTAPPTALSEDEARKFEAEMRKECPRT